VARIGTVRSTASLAVARTRSIRSGPAASAFNVSSTGTARRASSFRRAGIGPGAHRAYSGAENFGKIVRQAFALRQRFAAARKKLP
jgi:hypothetical protein